MKSIMERQLINGRKITFVEREAQDRSIEFLKRKYRAAQSFFLVLSWLMLIDRERKMRAPFGVHYLADKLTQRHTFGKYDGTRTERGARDSDPTSICTVPAWFSKPV